VRLALLLGLFAAAGAGQRSPEERAVHYLATEVPRWHRENHCFSCHNNGDAARALYAARRIGFPVPEAALSDTTRWLLAPGEWENNRGDPRFSDKRLARIQFAAALVESGGSGLRPALEAAANLLASDQQGDGSWPVEGGDALGSPATYGTVLSTWLARRTLEAAGAAQFRTAIQRADRWLESAPAGATIDAAAVALALHDRPQAAGKVNRVIERLGVAQTSDGGWGPYPKSPAEVFDTAVALLALHEARRTHPRLAGSIARGRAWLVSAQLPSGGWVETTRPSGGQSYAQHVSTTGWAALALLATRREDRGERTKGVRRRANAGRASAPESLARQTTELVCGSMMYTGDVADGSSLRAVPVFLLLGGSKRSAHVHLERERFRAKFWLDPVRLERSRGFGRAELRRLESLVEQEAAFLVRAWHDYFGN